MTDDPASGVRILSDGRNLVLRGVGRKSSGEYTCSAFNLEGNDTSKTVELRVKCKSIIYVFSACDVFKFTIKRSIDPVVIGLFGLIAFVT